MGRGGSRGYRVFQGSLEVKRFRVPQGFARSSQGFTGILYRAFGVRFQSVGLRFKDKVERASEDLGDSLLAVFELSQKVYQSFTVFRVWGFGGLWGSRVLAGSGTGQVLLGTWKPSL